MNACGKKVSDDEIVVTKNANVLTIETKVLCTFCILFMFQITAGNKFLVIKRLSTVVVDAAVAFIK